MRWQFKVLIAVMFGFVSLELVLGQPIQIPGLSLARLLGKEGRTDPLALLRNNYVKKELRVSDEQAHKVEAAIWKALAEVLDAEQVKRLRQIDLQQRDYEAFADLGVQEELQLSESQRKDIVTVLADAKKELDGLMKSLSEGGGGGVQVIVDKVKMMRKETMENCTAVLTADQKRTWQYMLGDAFDFGEGAKINLDELNPKLQPGKKGAAKGTAKGKKGG